MMGDGVKTMLTTRGKLIIDGYELDCIDLNINSPRFLSVSQLTKVGYTAVFTGNKLLLIKPMIGYENSKIRDAIKKFSQDWRKNTLEITQEDGLYKVNLKDGVMRKQRYKQIFSGDANDKKLKHLLLTDTSNIDLHMTMAPESPILRFHCAFGHMSLRNMKELKFEISESDEEQVRNCITCLTVKHKSKPTTGTKERNAEKIFQHIHVDTAGPFIRGEDTWYIVVIVDQYSRYMHTETTKSKVDIKHVLNNWLKEQHQIHQRKPEKITTDKGSEFVRLGYLHPEWYDGKVIDIITRVDLDLAPTGNKQWNGTAERAVQTIKLLQKLVTSHLKSESEANFLGNRWHTQQ